MLSDQLSLIGLGAHRMQTEQSLQGRLLLELFAGVVVEGVLPSEELEVFDVALTTAHAWLWSRVIRYKL